MRGRLRRLLCVALAVGFAAGCERASQPQAAQVAPSEPADPATLVARGDALMQQAREAPDAGYEQLAEAAFQQALAREPRDAAALAGLAWVTGFRHEFEASADWARRALAVNADNREAHGLLGDAALELGQDDVALEHYQAMLDLRPDLASYARAAELLYRTGDARRGIALMQKAVESSSEEPEHVAWARARLARMLWGVGDRQVAERVLAPAVTAAPDHVEVSLVRGLLATARRDWTAAIAAYEKARALSPRHEALVALVDLYRLAGREAESASMVEMVEALDGDTPGTPDAGVQMARFWCDHERRLDNALRRAEAAHAARPTPAADTLAWCYFRAGRFDAAAPLARAAVERRPGDAEMRFHAGMIEAARGDRAAARLDLYRALNTNPSFHPLYAQRASERLAELSGAASQEAGGLVGRERAGEQEPL